MPVNKKFACSKHGFKGNYECAECRKKLVAFLKHNNAHLIATAEDKKKLGWKK